jgi:hypothetical protein
VTQQRSRERGVCLAGGELVVLAAGQVRQPGSVDGIGFQRAPDRTPGRQAQRWASLPGQAGAAGVAAGALLPRRQPGVLGARRGENAMSSSDWGDAIACVAMLAWCQRQGAG